MCGLCQEIKDEKSEKEKSNLEKVEQAAKASVPAKGGKPEKGRHSTPGYLLVLRLLDPVPAIAAFLVLLFIVINEILQSVCEWFRVIWQTHQFQLMCSLLSVCL